MSTFEVGTEYIGYHPARRAERSIWQVIRRTAHYVEFIETTLVTTTLDGPARQRRAVRRTDDGHEQCHGWPRWQPGWAWDHARRHRISSAHRTPRQQEGGAG